MAVALVVTVLAGCTGDSGGDLPEFTPGPGATSSGPATTAPAPALPATGEVPARGSSLGPEGNPITVGRTVPARNADEKAVQLAYLRFWVERARALRAGKVDDAALRRVAVGQAADDVGVSVRGLAEDGNHAEGGSTVNIKAVSVTGRKARLTDCFQDGSYAVDADGKRQAPQPSANEYRVDLQPYGETWRVATFTRAGSGLCVP